ncbi:hypothetical protein [Pseudoteredinibacter isoporae]|uniref:hypothetical protein n=1 Tax=Pseudoteredinibacter isoporae TaxID=570281 RepID=UPI00310AF4CD
MKAIAYLTLAALLVLPVPAVPAQGVERNTEALKEGYGYLLLAIESLGTTPNKILLKGPKLFSSPSVQSIEPGNNYRLMPVPAGRYYFSQVYNDGKKDESAYWDILDFDYYIDVKADTVSYSGHFISEMYGEQEIDFVYRNRSSQAHEYLRNCCAEILQRYPLSFTGSYPDPFLDFLKLDQGTQ